MISSLEVTVGADRSGDLGDRGGHPWGSVYRHADLHGVTEPTTPASEVPAPETPAADEAAPTTVHPGGYCAEQGATGVSATGKTYTCGKAGADAGGRFHWNA